MQTTRKTLVGLMCLVAGLLCVLPEDSVCAADPTIPLLEKYCFDCHGEKQAEANVNLVGLAADPDVAARFKTWEKAAELLQAKRMPPADVAQPNDSERKQLIRAITTNLDKAVRRNAGDPGRVALRRLTSAEYAYTIDDLTGLKLPLEKTLTGDAVGGEGFTNVGDVQFMQDSSLERYLEAAKLVAAHAVIGTGPLSFYPDPGTTGRELSAIHRIQQIYRTHGFRTGAGEGAKPFGLDRYPRAFFVAWKYRHAQKLGLKNATLASLAKAHRLPVRFVEHIHHVLSQPPTSFPTDTVIEAWQALPIPQGEDAAIKKKVRADCDAIYATMHDWQNLLAAAAGDAEESPVLTANSFDVQPKHEFTADVFWLKDAKLATVELKVISARKQQHAQSLVIWRDPQVRFRRNDLRWAPIQRLGKVLTEDSARRLAIGRHPRGGEIGPHDFVLPVGTTVSIQLRIPPNSRFVRTLITTELDLQQGEEDIVRCSVSDGDVPGATAAETGETSAMLANPASDFFPEWKAGVLEFARKLPQVSHREPAPSDRDPIPAPFDNTYNTPERNLFHSKIKYHRDDQFLVEKLLDDPTRKQLDQAWADLLSSFEYHDLNLRFIANKYKLNLPEGGMAALSESQIEQLPAEPRAFVARLRRNFDSIQSLRKAAEPGQLDDATRFAQRAWRRPLHNSETEQLRSFYQRLRESEQLDHTQAMRALLARILVTPSFLYRSERPHQRAEVMPLSDWELANRLSYFLWSTLPDDELRRAATAGELQEPKNIQSQAKRMLRDLKARRLANEFFGQWFGFYRFNDYRGIDTGQFPEFTEELKQAMLDEAVTFFERLIREDRPPRDILFADYSYLNDNLSRHYGIEQKQNSGNELKRVAGLHEQHRGGLLGLGAVLATTSAPLRTSPVKRGDWILRRILGTPVPPPPADVGSISPGDALADGKSVRERLIAHRRDATCMNCHSRIDPLGFALENYDAIGRWRDQYKNEQPIDSTGQFADGKTISGPAGLRKYLRDREADFQRTLSVKLLGYALGRRELITDRPLIEEMMADLRDDGRFSDLIVRIVTSRQFRRQRGQGVERPENN